MPLQTSMNYRIQIKMGPTHQRKLLIITDKPVQAEF